MFRDESPFHGPWDRMGLCTARSVNLNQTRRASIKDQTQAREI
jgi:hypothetical protein